MSELSFEQMFEESSFKRLRTGEAVTGQVIGVKEDEIILSIAGSKSEGIITRSEFTNEPGVDLRTKVQVGDELEAKVLKVNDGEGMAALSYKRLAADKGLNVVSVFTFPAANLIQLLCVRTVSSSDNNHNINL